MSTHDPRGASSQPAEPPNHEGRWRRRGLGLAALVLLAWGGCDSNPTPHPIGPDVLPDTAPPGENTDRPAPEDDLSNGEGDPAAGFSDALGGDCDAARGDVEVLEVDAGRDADGGADAGGCGGDAGPSPSAPAAEGDRGDAGHPEPIGGRARR